MIKKQSTAGASTSHYFESYLRKRNLSRESHRNKLCFILQLIQK